MSDFWQLLGSFSEKWLGDLSGKQLAKISDVWSGPWWRWRGFFSKEINLDRPWDLSAGKFWLAYFVTDLEIVVDSELQHLF